jgi:hypothetical protein
LHPNAPCRVPLCHRHLHDVIDWLDALRERSNRADRERERSLREEREKRRTVYYVRRQDGLIKIGVSGQLNRRLRALTEIHGALTVLALHAGGREAEQRMHARFAADRVTGEWFQPSLILLDHIERLQARPAA